MKIFSFILALFIVGLNFFPCTDGSLADANHDSIFEFIPHKHAQPSDEEPENCSPFCVCDCCQITPIYFDFNVSFNIIEYTSFLFEEIKTSKPVKIANILWRPPATA